MVLPNKLNDKRRDPLVIGAENVCQMLFANKPAVMSCQKALKQFCLNGREPGWIDQRRIMVYAIGDGHRFSAHRDGERPGIPRRRWKNRYGFERIVSH